MIVPEIAKESTHWYAKDGTPCYEQPCKSRPGEMRATTVRDARVLGLVPSVTAVIRVAAQPGLERWKQQQLLHAALTLPRIKGESEDDFAKRAMTDAQEQSTKARDKGTEIHGAIERWLTGVRVAPELLPYCVEVEITLTKAGVDVSGLSTEHSFAHSLGYGGKVDIHDRHVVSDVKTKSDWEDERKLAYPEHAMQLAAYAHGLGIPDARLLNVFVATDEPGKVHVHEWPHGDWFERFELLLKYWRRCNGFPVT